ncbi:ATP-binding cassette domain-containing protein [Catenulispora sp. NF23]|uniref:ATP-binding cassette domain-containing protein n=1 Tax=Catenulispora pinistramenti TaxID=2705254 RepID=A0ABS5KWQ4_9ACTN|nr:ATP-binding cassette domain-containing protein [Catenulispora pinistramenti]MBS2535902.1 ATP-binding cassette domain-containing protein [Catenulispora pinistramenti]MBS2550409.1 ATP-binding cassette domain-containing protein [Catenulispora pinistramenti]
MTALDGVDLSVAAGEVYGVVGRSGAGKSTLIRCVNLLERPTSGTVSVAGRELTALSGRQLRAERRRIGMVFQHFNLLSSRSARENVELPLEIGGSLTRRERRARADELLDVVGLADRADAHPAQLSGGQKQRVGIARALAADPHVLLSDEATSALDPETTRSVLRLLKEVNERLGVTVLLITHEMDVVKAVCDSAALMRDGRIVESGTISDLLTRERSELARELFQLGPAPEPAGAAGAEQTTVLDVTFHGDSTAQPLISQLARTYSVDVTILGAAIETVNGQTVGRMRIGLPGRFEDNVVQVGFLRERGLNVETVAVGAAADETVAPGTATADSLQEVGS